MNKILYFLIFVISLSLVGCDDFLDTESLTQTDTSTYPATADDADEMLTAIYSTLNLATANCQESYWYAANLASDDMFGGGGENDKLMQAVDLIMNYGTSMLQDYWEARYKGIYRANMAIETFDGCTGFDSDATKNQIIGEAYFMRAFFYFELTSFFGEVPLITSTSVDNVAKSEPAEEYAQIASDLKNAIEMMKSVDYTSIESGHATKWAAEALMARVFLFYTGFYDQSTLPLTDGGTVTKDEVVEWLEDCIDNSGHSLVSDYRELWAYTNSYTVEDYEYTKDQNLEWIENDSNTNPETLFAIKYSNFASWSTTTGYSNMYMLFFGIRGSQDLESTFPFGQGWGSGPVNPVLWDEWKSEEPDDIRREATIASIPDELPDYTYGGGSWGDYVQETDYLSKKYMPITAYDDDAGDYVNSFSVLMYGTTDNYQLDNVNDLILIRMADVYLMHSELTETNTYLNRVRERAGLADEEYSLENIQNERRWEFACEGIRWNDIRRWGIAKEVLDKQEGVSCYFKGNPTVTKAFGGGYASRYEETGGGFYPIPEDEIELSDGVLIQNDGWETSTSDYSGWN